MKNLLTIGLMSLASLGAWAQTQGEKNDTTQAEASDSVALEARMQDIAITAQRQLVRQDVDRIGYDVAADEDSRTLSVLDMLRKVPYVTVDGNDNILVKGGSAFRVYKNGRPDPALTKNAKEILRAMPASMVRRIEVVTSPGAKEDAEGVQAILNIVLKDNGGMEGVTGSVSANINTLLHPNAGAYVMTQAGPLTVSANYGYGGMSKRETEGRYEGHMDYAATGHHVESDSRQPRTQEQPTPEHIPYIYVYGAAPDAEPCPGMEVEPRRHRHGADGPGRRAPPDLRQRHRPPTPAAGGLRAVETMGQDHPYAER